MNLQNRIFEDLKKYFNANKIAFMLFFVLGLFIFIAIFLVPIFFKITGPEGTSPVILIIITYPIAYILLLLIMVPFQKSLINYFVTIKPEFNSNTKTVIRCMITYFIRRLISLSFYLLIIFLVIGIFFILSKLANVEMKILTSENGMGALALLGWGIFLFFNRKLVFVRNILLTFKDKYNYKSIITKNAEIINFKREENNNLYAIMNIAPLLILLFLVFINNSLPIRIIAVLIFYILLNVYNYLITMNYIEYYNASNSNM